MYAAMKSKLYFLCNFYRNVTLVIVAAMGMDNIFFLLLSESYVSAQSALVFSCE